MTAADRTQRAAVSDGSRMLAALFADGEGFVELRVIANRGGVGQEWFPVGECEHAARRAVELRDHGNVYVGVAARSRRQGTKDAVAAVPVLWADLDDAQATVELAAFTPPPSIVVKTGSPGAHHAYWLLSEHVDPGEAERLNGLLAKRLGGDPRVVDAARVLRVPGTLNHKHDPPAEVSLELLDGTRYAINDIREALGDIGAVDVGSPIDAPVRAEPGAPVTAVLDRLDGVRPSGNGWTALCPAHDDTNPSLSVAQGDDGRCLLNCFAGCTVKDIVAAVGLKMADLFPGEQGTRALSAVLVDLAEHAGVELFHDRLEQPLAVVPVDDHREVWPIESRKFRRWLRHRLRTELDRVANAQAISDAAELLSAQALFDGPEREVFVRVANSGDTVFVDLGDADWRAVEIRAGHWQVVSVPPVAFLRRPSTLALPEPATGASIDELRSFINVGDDRSWYLVVAFLVASLAGIGPFPILVLQGEQGSAKSTTARMLRLLVDPVKAMLRAGSPDERDLMIAAAGQWLPGFDNVTRLTERLADALCQLSTGAGFATRQLYTDSEEVIFEAMRPTVLNGIAGISHRDDFLSRALLIDLPEIPEDRRVTEADLWARFEQARPRIFGALLDTVADAVRELPDVRLTQAPRLADFARVGTAVERASGWPPGSLLEALEASQAGGVQDVLDAEPIAAVLQEFVAKWRAWDGTMTKLLECLNTAADDELTRQRGWPKNAAQLGIRLKRIAPALRKNGVLVEDAPAGRDRQRRRGVHIRSIGDTTRSDGGDGGDGGDDS